MEKFIVSARKYRPQNFALVVGQEHITTTLKNAIQQNTLAHAFLFCGPRGVGKTTCARILAKTINCENLQPDGEACNNCNSCTSFNQGASLNIHELDAASNNSVDDIRELVAQVRFAPQEGKYKVYIIDEVHMLSASAFNAFLKTLEEPPSYAKFILATTEKHKILPTILSRCQIFDFKRITNADTVTHLQKIAGQENIEAEKAALQLIAQKSEGCMRDALSILDKIVAFTSGELTYQNTLEHLNLLDEDYYFKMLRALLSEDLATALLLYDSINAKGFEGNTVLEGFAGFLRNLMVSKDERAAALLDVLEGMQEQYAAEAKNTSLSYLVSALNVVNQAIITYRDAQHKRLHVELCLIKLCYLQQAISLASDGQGQIVKKRTVHAPVAMKERPVTAALLSATKPVAAEAKLTIQPAPSALKKVTRQEAEEEVLKTTMPVMPGQNQLSTVAEPTPPVEANTGTDRNKLLSRLKQKVSESRSREGELQTRNPVAEEVAALWHEHAAKLKAEEKHTIASAFTMALLGIDAGHGENVVVATVSNKIQQRLLEMEATTIVEKFRQCFNNVHVNLVVEVSEKEEDKERNTAPHLLSSKERYELMIQHYPLVKELKDALKLDLGYS